MNQETVAQGRNDGGELWILTNTGTGWDVSPTLPSPLMGEGPTWCLGYTETVSHQVVFLRVSPSKALTLHSNSPLALRACLHLSLQP